MLDTMEMNTINAIRNDDGYDFIANNAHLMGTEMLKRIVMECLYEIHLNDDRNSMLNNIADELKDHWDY